MDAKTELKSGLRPPFKKRYENFIGGKWVAPVAGKYFANISPITGATICEVPRSDAQDIEKALDAAHAAKDAWGRTSPAERARILNQIADRIEANIQLLAEAETWDNGKPIREIEPRRHSFDRRSLPLFRRLYSRAGRQRRRDRSTTPSPITSTSRWAWSARSSPGTSRS